VIFSLNAKFSSSFRLFFPFFFFSVFSCFSWVFFFLVDNLLTIWHPSNHIVNLRLYSIWRSFHFVFSCWYPSRRCIMHSLCSQFVTLSKYAGVILIDRIYGIKWTHIYIDYFWQRVLRRLLFLEIGTVAAFLCS